MKKWKLLFAFLLTAACVSTVFAHPTPEGDWLITDDKTGQKRAIVHFVVRNDTLYGTIEKIYPLPGDTGICSACPGNFKDKPIQGLQIVWGLKEKGPGSWGDGHILDAKGGKIYRVKMAVKGDKLYLRGYIGVSILGRTNIWTKA
jgi:uncharacterized protein (DUF2147 family)